MRDYEGLIQSATAAMIEKLTENEFKDDFDKVTLKEALNRIGDETMELSVEIYSHSSIQQIRREAADVANFAAMIIYNCDRLIAEIERVKG